MNNPKNAVVSDAAPAAIGPYSQAVQSDRWLFLSGQIGLDPATGNLVAGGVREQTEQTLKNLEAVLSAGGSDLAGVLKTTVYMTDLAQFPVMNEVYAKRFPPPFPARATLQVSALPKGALIEIDAVALKNTEGEAEAG